MNNKKYFHPNKSEGGGKVDKKNKIVEEVKDTTIETSETTEDAEEIIIEEKDDNKEIENSNNTDIETKDVKGILLKLNITEDILDQSTKKLNKAKVEFFKNGEEYFVGPFNSTKEAIETRKIIFAHGLKAFIHHTL